MGCRGAAGIDRSLPARQSLREAIAEHRPPMAKLQRVSAQLAELSPEQGAAFQQRWQEAEEQYGRIRERVRRAAAVLEDAIPRYSQVRGWRQQSRGLGSPGTTGAGLDPGPPLQCWGRAVLWVPRPCCAPSVGWEMCQVAGSCALCTSARLCPARCPRPGALPTAPPPAAGCPGQQPPVPAALGGTCLSPQLTERMDLLRECLERLQSRVQDPPTARGDATHLREQLRENSLALGELEKLGAALETVRVQGAELLAGMQAAQPNAAATGTDPRLPGCTAFSHTCAHSSTTQGVLLATCVRAHTCPHSSCSPVAALPRGILHATSMCTHILTCSQQCLGGYSI